MTELLPNLDRSLFDDTNTSRLGDHKPRILLLYGSTRERSFSRLLTEEAARLLEYFGAETRLFDPSGLPLPDDAPAVHRSATVQCQQCSRRKLTGYRLSSAPFVLPREKPWR
jgi:hypothetical protein